MAKTIFDPTLHASLFVRLDKLQESTVPQWGIMKPNQMVRHVREALKINTGEMDLGDRSTIFTRTLIRWFVLNSMVPSAETARKRPVVTLPEINVVEKPIPAADLATEKRLLREATDKAIKEDKWAGRAPLLGHMSRADWGKLMHSHMHYHLSQFGL